MVDSKRVLTQEQINAMLAGAAGEQSAEKPVNVTPTSMKEIRARGIGRASSASDSASSASDEPPQATIAQLIERVSKLEAAMKQGEAGSPELPKLLEQL